MKRWVGTWLWRSVAALVLAGCGRTAITEPKTVRDAGVVVPKPTMPAREAVLTLVAIPASIEDSGAVTQVIATAALGGLPGSGVVRFNVQAGFLGGQTVALDALGRAVVAFRCPSSEDPSCQGQVLLEAEWTVEGRPVSTSVEITVIPRAPVVCQVEIPTALDISGGVFRFNSGLPLAAGRYRIQNLGGCLKYSIDQNWTVNALANGESSWWLVGATTSQQLLIPPGTVGYVQAPEGGVRDIGAFVRFEDCDAASSALPPLEFDFPGGLLGLWLRDPRYDDNVGGLNGRNPNWSLSKITSDCP